jgi:hypothetical protein
MLICKTSLISACQKLDRLEIHGKAIQRELYRVTATGYSDYKNWSCA